MPALATRSVFGNTNRFALEFTNLCAMPIPTCWTMIDRPELFDPKNFATTGSSAFDRVPGNLRLGIGDACPAHLVHFAD